MAVQGTIVTIGGLTAPDAYLRVSDLIMKKIVEGTDSGKWTLTYGVHCYVSASARASDVASKLTAPSVDRFQVVSDDEPRDPYAAAYADLKGQSAVANASDLV